MSESSITSCGKATPSCLPPRGEEGVSPTKWVGPQCNLKECFDQFHRINPYTLVVTVPTLVPACQCRYKCRDVLERRDLRRAGSDIIPLRDASRACRRSHDSRNLIETRHDADLVSKTSEFLENSEVYFGHSSIGSITSRDLIHSKSFLLCVSSVNP